MNQPWDGCTCVPYPEPPFYLPPHPIPQGHPSAPALSTLSHASNLDWWSISHNFKVVFVTQLCPDLCDPMDCSPPGSSVHGILQARILEWVAISFFCRSFWPRDWARVSSIAGGFFTIWASREAQVLFWSFCGFKKKFFCRVFASNKMQPILNNARVTFNQNREKVWENLFSGASYYFWIWTWIPFLLK